MNSGLMKVVAFFVIVGLIVFEAGAIAVNRVQLDDIAGQVARAAAEQVGTSRSARGLEQAALEEAPEDVEVEHVELTGTTVQVVVSRKARVLVLDRIGPLADWAHARVTKTAELR